jgi:hypothetical protein
MTGTMWDPKAHSLPQTMRPHQEEVHDTTLEDTQK